MEDRKLWKFTAVYRYDDASRVDCGRNDDNEIIGL